MPDSRIEIVKENIDRLRQDRAHLSEKELAHINELAEILCDEAGEDEIFFFDDAFISRYKALTERYTVSGVADFNLERVNSGENLQRYKEKAFLCTRICDVLGIRGIKDVGTFFEGLSEERVNSVSCVKSPLADEAYLKISSVLDDARVVYADDLAEACENVYYGRSTYCILPFANTLDGRLTTIRALAIKYGLKTSQLCRVKNNDGEFTSFALMKKELMLPVDDSDLYFEIRINGLNAVNELVSVAMVYGFEISEISYFSGEGGFCDMTFKVNDESICGFLSYLYLEFPDFIPVGLFKEI